MDFLFGVGIGARVFAVLFTAGVALVALSAVGGEATMPDSVPARQVRLGNKKVRFMVKNPNLTSASLWQ